MEACILTLTSVTLHQYDQSPSTVKVQSHSIVKVNERVLEAPFIVWMYQQNTICLKILESLLEYDVSALSQEAMQVHSTSEGADKAEHLCSEYANVFKEDLGVLQEIEDTVSVDPKQSQSFIVTVLYLLQ